MSVSVAIHQPNFIPWLGYFLKMDRADSFIILDKVLFSRLSYTQRVKILNDHKASYITVPVHHPKGASHRAIDEIEIAQSTKNFLKMTKILLFNYRRLPYWKQYGEPIIEILNKKHRRLIDLNMELLQFIAESLGISWGKISLQSSYKYSGNKSELMASLAHAAGGNIYLSGGNKSDHYNDTKIYCSYDVTLKYQDFVHPHYDQGQRNFEPGLSVIDALIRFGKDTMPMVRKVNPEN